MSLEYRVNNNYYVFSYPDLKALYTKFKLMSDEEFMSSLPDIIHFACFVCYIKDIPTEDCLNDEGIIHELVHLLKKDGTITPLETIRHLFNTKLIIS